MVSIARAGPSALTSQARHPRLNLIGVIAKSQLERCKINTRCYNQAIDLFFCDAQLFVIQGETKVEARKLGDKGHGVGEYGSGTASFYAGYWIKYRSHPNEALVSYKRPSTLAAKRKANPKLNVYERRKDIKPC